MLREIKFENMATENLGHIKDARLKSSGYLYLSDWYKLEDRTNLDMVILEPMEVIKLRNFLNESFPEEVVSDEVQDERAIKSMVENGVEDIFVDIAKYFSLEFGDLDVPEVAKLDEIKEELLKIAKTYIKLNTPSEEE